MMITTALPMAMMIVLGIRSMVLSVMYHRVHIVSYSTDDEASSGIVRHVSIIRPVMALGHDDCAVQS